MGLTLVNYQNEPKKKKKIRHDMAPSKKNKTTPPKKTQTNSKNKTKQWNKKKKLNKIKNGGKKTRSIEGRMNPLLGLKAI